MPESPGTGAIEAPISPPASCPLQPFRSNGTDHERGRGSPYDFVQRRDGRHGRTHYPGDRKALNELTTRPSPHEQVPA